MTPKEQQIIDILIIAIKGGNLIRFEYDGQIRIVEPYLIGELYSKFQNHLEEGKYAQRAWFVRGYTKRPIDKSLGDRWRIYNLDKMRGRDQRNSSHYSSSSNPNFTSTIPMPPLLFQLKE